VTLLTYDSGGHDEYKEMNASFLTRDALYGMIFDVSRPRPGEAEEVAIAREAREKLAAWVTLVAACAPGATMLLVCTHADEVLEHADAAELERRCARMAECVEGELRKHSDGQRAELGRLQGMEPTDVTSRRIEELEQALASPMRLRPQGRALAVSSKTLHGVDTLRSLLLETAFDKECFPRFGNVEPGTYGRILRQLRWTHQTESSLTRGQVAATLRCAAVAESAGQQIQCQLEVDGLFKECSLMVALASTSITVDCGGSVSRASTRGLSTRPPRTARAGRPQCLRIDLRVPDSAGRHKYIVDCVDQARINAMRATFAQIESQAQATRVSLLSSKVRAQADGKEFVRYSFEVTCADGTFMPQRWSVRYSAAETAHALLGSDVVGTLAFPGSYFDGPRDMIHVPSNVARRGEELRAYYEQLLRVHDVPSLLPVLREVLQRRRLGDPGATLLRRYVELPAKLREDSGLLDRALLYLRVTGEVLCHDLDLHHVRQNERVFLEPQRLVDIMKALVHHDLACRLDQLDTTKVAQSALVRQLGKRFVLTGEVDRRLLPWLWQELDPPVGNDPAQLDFLVNLLVQLGLLTPLTTEAAAASSVWLLPMRLPDLHTIKRAQGNFTAIQARMDNRTPISSLDDVLQPIVQAGGALTQAFLDERVAVAQRKVQQLASEGPDPDHGLSDLEIMALNMYSQEAKGADGKSLPLQLYRELNRALRSADADQIRAFWMYIRLLQQALDKLPESPAGTLFRGISEPGSRLYTLERLQAMVREGRPEIWWGFSSTSTDLPTVTQFLGGSTATEQRLIFVLDGGGSSAKDIRHYSQLPQENELLLPCGMAFEVKSATSPARNLIEVHVKEAPASLFGHSSSHTEVAALTDFQGTLDAEHAVVDSASRVFEFHHALPTGLIGVTINRCKNNCCQDHPAVVWRRDLIAVLPVVREQARRLDAATTQGLLSMSAAGLREEAQAQGVTKEYLLGVEAAFDDSRPNVELKQGYIEAIAMAPVQVEISVRQDGASKIVIASRCLRDSEHSHHDLCVAQLGVFQEELERALKEQWPGCLPSASGDGVAIVGLSEGIPPDCGGVGDEPEPEPETYLGSE
jgi:hypothetical protein